MKKNKITAVILAAGQGKRMNTPVVKQFLTLKDKPVLYYSLNTFEKSSVDDIILVTGNGQEEYCKKNIVDFYHIDKVSQIIEGGKERYDSVFKALNCITDTDYVLIHDGARPFISTDIIESVISSVVDCKACIAGVPVKETVKTVDQNGMITSTPDRNTLWTAQTPQAFEFASILKAYELLYKEDEGSRIHITDDAMVYETYIKLPVKMIQGSYNNIKLTTPEDYIQAQGIMKDIV